MDEQEMKRAVEEVRAFDRRRYRYWKEHDLRGFSPFPGRKGAGRPPSW